MKFKNGWTAVTKQFDKLQIKLRISFITVFELDLDISKRELSLTLMNFSLQI